MGTRTYIIPINTPTNIAKALSLQDGLRYRCKVMSPAYAIVLNANTKSESKIFLIDPRKEFNVQLDSGWQMWVWSEQSTITITVFNVP